jgi:hypothetical protein
LFPVRLSACRLDGIIELTAKVMLCDDDYYKFT